MTLREKLERDLREVRERLMNAVPYGYLADQETIRELKRRRAELEYWLSRAAI